MGQPLRVTDTTSPTAYTSGNGTSQGRLSLPPSNTQDTFSGTAVGALAHRTRWPRTSRSRR